LYNVRSFGVLGAVVSQMCRGRHVSKSRKGFKVLKFASKIMRHILGGVVVALIGLGCFGAPGGGRLLGAALTTLEVLLLWGSPAVVVNTAGQEKNAGARLALGTRCRDGLRGSRPQTTRQSVDNWELPY
jgi:hypothetical protein